MRISTKYSVGNPAAADVPALLEKSLDESLRRMRMERVDLFFLHGRITPDDAVSRYQGTPRTLFMEAVRPAYERLVGSGRIGAWGITGIGVPTAVIDTIDEEPPPLGGMVE